MFLFRKLKIKKIDEEIEIDITEDEDVEIELKEGGRFCEKP